MCWFMLWALLAGSTPASHKYISARERHYIESTVIVGKTKEMRTPWLRILMSPHVWAIAVAHFCGNWGVYTLMTCMPTFLANIGVLPENGVSNLTFLAVPRAHTMVLCTGCGAQWCVLWCPICRYGCGGSGSWCCG